MVDDKVEVEGIVEHNHEVNLGVERKVNGVMWSRRPNKHENFRGAKDSEADAPGPVRRGGRAKPVTTWRTRRTA